MTEDLAWVPFDLLEAFMVDVFKGVGVPEEDARVCADVLISADKRGIDSHGVGRLKPIYYDRIVKGGIQKPVTEFEVVRDCKATAVVDGHDGMGMVIGKRCMQMAIDKAREHGLGMVTARNSTHYGFAAYYSLMAVREGMIGLTGTNARPSIAPTHGIDNMLGTNPLVFAMPTDEEFPLPTITPPRSSRGAKSNSGRAKGRTALRAWSSIGKAGRPLTRCRSSRTWSRARQPWPRSGPHRRDWRLQGLRFRHRGGDIVGGSVAGGLSQATRGQRRPGQRYPHPTSGTSSWPSTSSCFTDLAAFKKTTGDILRALRASTKAPGRERIYTCGEKRAPGAMERKDKGAPIDAVVRRELMAMRDDLGLPYRFPFEDS